MRFLFLHVILFILSVQISDCQVFTAEALDITPKPEYSSSFEWVDLDNDRDMDLICTSFLYSSSPYFKIYANTNGTFTEVINLLDFTNGQTSTASGDYDADGDIDFLIADNSVHIIINNGDLTFHRLDVSMTSGNVYPEVHWRDIDNDADLDIILDNLIFINSDGVFKKALSELPLVTNMSWCDVNNDGLLDMIGMKGGNISGNPLVVCINKGDGVLREESQITDNFANTGIKLWLDADGDHDIDVLLTEANRVLTLFRNKLSESGELAFERDWMVQSVDNPIIDIGDVNLDGLPDIIINEDADLPNYRSTSLFENISSNGSIVFNKVDLHLDAYRVFDLNLIDIDSDHDLDFIINGVKDSQFSNIIIDVNKNTSPASQGPLAPTLLTTTVGKDVTLKWEHADNIHPCYYNIELKKDGQLFRSSISLSDGTLLMPDIIELQTSKTFSFVDLPEGDYEWRVQAIDYAFRPSAFSEFDAFEIKGAPQNLRLESLAYNTVKLDWNFTTSGQTGFSIFRKSKGNGLLEIGNINPEIRSFTDRDIPANEHFEYVIRATNNGTYSASSNVVGYYSAQFLKIPFDGQLPNIVDGDGVSADFDLDGDYDFGFIGKFDNQVGNSGMMINDGTGAYTLSSFLPTDRYSSLVGKDFDNDGDTDICTISSNEFGAKSIVVLENQNNVFTKVFQSPVYSDIYQLAVEDLNQDGRVDLFFSRAARYNSIGPVAYQLLYQTADLNFEGHDRDDFLNNDIDIGKFHFSDIDGDGFTDVIFSGKDRIGAQIFKNLSGRGFKKVPEPFQVLGSPYFTDLDGDSKVDIMDWNYPAVFYPGMGNFQFSEAKLLTMETSMSVAAHVDMDLDGLPDFMCISGQSTQLINNKGNGDLVQSGYEFDKYWGTAAFLTDLENDGDIDLIKLSQNYDNNFGYGFFYKNHATTSDYQNSPPSSPSQLQAIQTIGETRFSWSASTDDTTPQNLISYNLWIQDANEKNWIHPETNEAGTFHRRPDNGNVGKRNWFPINDLPPGQYTARVQSVDASFALSAWSSDFEFTIAEGPSDLTINRILLNKVQLQWTNGPNAEDKVIVVRKSVESDFEIVAELPSGTVSYVDDNLVYENIYTYSIIEISNDLLTARSNDVEWSTLLLIPANTNLPSFSGPFDVGDYTGDSRMDLIAFNEQSGVLLENTGVGWTMQNVDSQTSPLTSALTFQDINGDHRLDLYGYGRTGFEVFQTEVFKNNGDKTFSVLSDVFSSNNYQLVDWWDYDMDNDPDAFVAKESGSGPQSNIILKNNGDGNFAPGFRECGACNASYLFFSDFDNDGDEDMVDVSDRGYIVMLNGFSGLLPGPAIEQNFIVSTGYPVDYDGDGWVDIFFLSSEATQAKSTLFKNLGTDASGKLNFEMVKDDFPTGGNVFVNWADYDHDGDLDFFFIGPESFAYQNLDGESFEQRKLPFLDHELNQSQWMDVDNDGDLDLIASSPTSERSVLINQLIVAGHGIENLPPAPPVNLSTSEDSTGVHLRWDVPEDDHTPKSALTFDVILYKNGRPVTKALIDPETGTRLKLKTGRNFSKLYLKALAPGEYTWKVQAIDQTFMGSSLSASGNLVFRPLQPGIASDTILYICDHKAITAKGENIEWFSDKNATIKIGSGEFHPEQSQIVYATQTVNGLKSFAKKVTITVYDRPLKPVILSPNPLPFCEYEAGFRGAIKSQDELVSWYSDRDRKDLLYIGNNFPVIAKEKSYYAAQVIQGCASEVVEVKVVEETIQSTVRQEGDKLITLEEQGDYYEWFLYKESIPKSNNYFIEIADSGTYTVGIIKGHCYEFSDPFVITDIPHDQQNKLDIFPNPVTNDFTIKIPPMEGGTLQIVDMNGKVVYKRVLDSISLKGITLSSAGWMAGIYFVSITDGEKVLYGKVLKI